MKQRLLISVTLLWVSCASASPNSNESPLKRVGNDGLPLALLLSSPPEALQRMDIAKMNLLCVQELPGTLPMEVDQCLAKLDKWAVRSRIESERHQYRFARSPGEFEHSEGFFKMLILAVVLVEDFGVHYVPTRQLDPASAADGDGFFANPSDVFLHGVLGAKRGGTCSSLPVLYVAIGRRLGYPLKLVTTKGHLFVRWEGRGERFNIEVSGQGLNRFDDNYYRKWPFPVTDEEVAAEGYLKSLTAPEELAVFLSIRGMCLREAGRRVEAADSFAAAARFAPNCRSYKRMELRLRDGITTKNASSPKLKPKPNPAK
jgi:Transglutaminase-like superfamily